MQATIRRLSAEPPGAVRAWIAAMRPATLLVSVGPVLVGTACAHARGALRPGPALAALAGALLLQIAANLWNDAADAARGADGPDRLGPSRAVASGWLEARSVRRATFAALAAAFAMGLYLTAAAGWPVVVIGLCSMVAALAYTSGPWPLAYRGLGEVAVVLFFGVLATSGTEYVQARSVSAPSVTLGVGLGCLAAAVLVVNNLRDRDADARAGKRTLAARYGRRFAVAEYAALLGLAHLLVVLLVMRGAAGPSLLLGLLTAPWAIVLAARVRRSDGRALNPL
ncbi:MAG: 1,4-dihydroxy-2-naphthoate polyprenyltransferase, partial [Myxococcota bacterium]|nr:1,4-dihydroxy-2-naphthoate polyprenyltransferase [Myxococcota bacterium]